MTHWASKAATMGVTVVFLILLRRLGGRILVFWFMALPGVFAHEMTHWIIAKITFGRPGLPRLIPKKIGPGQYALGRVPVYRARWYNGAMIGLAPLLLVPAAMAILFYGTPDTLHWDDAWRVLLTGWAAAECLLECVPSSADWHMSRLSLLPGIALAGWACYWAGWVGH